MVRRIGFGEAKRTGTPVREAEVRAAPPPAVRRDWGRIVVQCLWVDLWLIGIYATGRHILGAMQGASAAPPADLVMLLAGLGLGALLSVRRLVRLLRGEPAAPGGS